METMMNKFLTNYIIFYGSLYSVIVDLKGKNLGKTRLEKRIDRIFFGI